MDIQELKQSIEKANAEAAAGNEEAIKAIKSEIFEVIALLDSGKLRVASKEDGKWVTHVWIKQAILDYFRLNTVDRMEVGPFVYFDKIPLKKNYATLNVRVVPPATARYGTFMEPGVVLMPSYVNIGAYIGANTMVDTWATVGSCAQIGANVHLSGGVGIGGVLEPAQASPVIVEDGAFIGSRCIIVEGVRIGEQAVLSANVTLTASTPIIDIRGDKLKETKGSIPPRCVVIPGTKEKKVKGGKIYTACAYIIGVRKKSTDLKTSLNQVLREHSLSV
jgi:2,3,4,5-tetrahydropyridine-2,6-dicarboxylate N-succinyltransferase